MYVAVDRYPCVRLLNLSGEIGCSNPGLNKVVAPIIKLKDVKDLLQPHTILVTAAAMEDFFTRVTSDLSFANKIGGSSFNNRKPVVLTVASMDSASFFRDKIFGADSPISGLVALLGAVDGFGNLKKQLVYLVLTGETWGYLGSKRFLYELDLHSDVIAKYIGNQTALQAFDEMTQSRHKNLNLQKEKRSLASKSWRFKYKYHNDMVNRLVIEAIQEIECNRTSAF